MNVPLPTFSPCVWLKSPHAQTIAATWFKPKKIDGRPDRLELPDGDFIDLLWYGRAAKHPRIVLILHGLEGGEDSHYIRSVVPALLQAEFTVVFMFHRGCSAEHNRLDRSYHSGETGDMDEVMRHIEQLSGEPVYAAVGYSLGANALLKYLGEQGRAARVARAVAISAPFELHAACLKLDQGWSRVYQRHLLARLIRRYQDKFRHRPSALNQDVSRLKTFLAFDEHVTAVINGFSGALDYYTRSSSRQYLSQIQKRCLIIHAKDDPFLPGSAVPTAHELPENVQLELQDYGGHVGFLEGKYLPRRWLDKAILTFLQA